jgi:riboflavin synthase
MFTGLVEGQGVVRQIIKEGEGLRLTITPPWALTTDTLTAASLNHASVNSLAIAQSSKASFPQASLVSGAAQILGALTTAIPSEPMCTSVGSCTVKPLAVMGESIALNGCCLTVVSMTATTLDFQAGPETLKRTNLGLIRQNDRLNVERSMKIGDSLGGHIVQGHVDGQGSVLEIIHEGEWTTIYFSAPPELTRMMVSKGSICVDGVSLTLVDVQAEKFSVALIPHTLEITTLGQRKVGDVVNLEVDILAKHLAKLAEPLLEKWMRSTGPV